ncbi:hypothetical protein CPB85DRAFT_1472570 [Mucidula mucida]|nr:hypothetical protein CPB85DRAFT_1472570 [Mucidula mucida]
MELTPSDRILCTSQTFLERMPAGESCYWMPAAVDFPGIDGTFVDGKGDVFVLQAAITGDHSDPEDGLQRAWAAMSNSEERRWHFVFVGIDKVEADALLDVFGPRMRGLKLGGNPIDVWGCALNMY